MNRKGFTLIEVLIVLVLTVVVGAFAFANYSGKQAQSQVSFTAQEIAATLHEAQSSALAGRIPTSNSGAGQAYPIWGVVFANPTTTAPFYTIIASSSSLPASTASSVTALYGTGPSNGTGAVLPSSIAYTTATVPLGKGVVIYYSNGSGGVPMGAYESCIGFTCPTSASTTYSVGLYTPDNTPVISSTISVGISGDINY